MQSNWHVHTFKSKRKYGPEYLVMKSPGAGKVRRSKITGAHKFMSRSDREALCRKLGG
jgi:hypothetical protein